MQSITHGVIYRQHGHTWVWTFSKETLLQATRDVVRTAARNDTPFRWVDAWRVCNEIRKEAKADRQSA